MQKHIPTYIYLIHFREKLSHSQHYLGATEAIRQRLIQHAQGRGSRILQVCLERSIEWRLARLFVLDALPWTYEHHMKLQKNAPAFCPLCNPDELRTLPGFVDYPLSSVPFPMTSQLLRKESSK